MKILKIGNFRNYKEVRATLYQTETARMYYMAHNRDPEESPFWTVETQRAAARMSAYARSLMGIE